MNLTEHFTLHEMTESATARKFGIDNQAPASVINNLMRTANLLEQVRSLLGSPVIISSGYRSPALNRAIGGAGASAHVEGLAVDFSCPKFGTPYQICQAIERSDIEFQQLIFEGTWVHISAPRSGAAARRQILTAHFDGKPVRYSVGLVV
ncbi:D-Ala-D-Ala carboxypeptidase family metallohydrolase [Pandoraea sp. SD6-2]|uniref:D-Ala-D-Ala carboxypeptidase family metallohydrolase n=1 Tax=Pandoraea sp. SD6-2 TaxID=1286093 RepID=UPI00032E8F01|nr:D-Ala-D-Ala carboxypeptidase family metallohydrolase [Pandoraea sp. SD6-2]EON14942.1 hypothetical protein C266_04159 [Pandoraea sp. SD6-2]